MIGPLFARPPFVNTRPVWPSLVTIPETILHVTALYSNHCTIQQSLHYTAITALYTNHCTIQQSLHYTASTALYSNPCAIQKTLHTAITRLYCSYRNF